MVSIHCRKAAGWVTNLQAGGSPPVRSSQVAEGECLWRFHAQLECSSCRTPPCDLACIIHFCGSWLRDISDIIATGNAKQLS